MDTKILVLLLLGVSLLAFGCAGKKAQAPPTFGDGAAPEANDTADDGEEMADDSKDGAMDDETMDDGNGTTDDDSDENESMNSSKDLSDLADLFKVDTDKPLEDEGFDVKSVDSNKS